MNGVQTNLAQLQPGEKGRITGIGALNPKKRRLMDMGMIVGGAGPEGKGRAPGRSHQGHHHPFGGIRPPLAQAG